MFSIYGITRQTFRGTPEQLALVGAVRLSSTRDDDPAGANTGFGQPGHCRWRFM